MTDSSRNMADVIKEGVHKRLLLNLALLARISLSIQNLPKVVEYYMFFVAVKKAGSFVEIGEVKG